MWHVAVENGAKTASRTKLHVALKDIQSGKILMETARRALPELNQIGKGVDWGEGLMKFAWSNPRNPALKNGEVEFRPIVEAVNSAIRTIGSEYHWVRTEMRMDLESGKMVKRK